MRSLPPSLRVPTYLDVEALRRGNPSSLCPAIPKASRLLCASKRQPVTRGRGDFWRPPVTDRRTDGQTNVILYIDSNDNKCFLPRMQSNYLNKYNYCEQSRDCDAKKRTNKSSRDDSLHVDIPTSFMKSLTD